MIFVCAALLPKIWQTSPVNFVPVIKVSALDLIQAASLKRSAAKLMRQRRWDDANYAWLSAWWNNFADAEALRGLLVSWLESERRGRSCVSAAQQALTLLRLTRTNRTDLPLAINVFAETRNSEMIIALLGRIPQELPLPMAKALLQGLFDQSAMLAVPSVWNALAPSLKSDTELQLYCAAYLAGWGPVEVRSDGWQLLQRNTNIPARETLAARLLLKVSEHRLDQKTYLRELNRLIHAGSDRLSDHLGYGRLLVSLGQKGEAREWIEECPRAATAPDDAIALAKLYFSLGLQERALRFLKTASNEFGYVPSFWIYYGNELVKAERWGGLRRVALEMRQQELDRPLAAYSHYLEGRSEIGFERKLAAAAAFRKMVEWRFPSTELALIVANALFEAEHFRAAIDVLQSVEQACSNSVDYWMLLYAVADKFKRPDLMLIASQRAHALRPSDPIIASNYAAALLINRRQPEAAMTLTLLVKARHPESTAATINYSAALLQNERVMEAEIALQSISTNRLNRAETAIYLLDLFEIHLKLDRRHEALQTGSAIEIQHLYPTQREWLERSRRELLARAAG